MKHKSTDDIRRLYLEFFKGKNHKVLPSDSLVPENDPTLLFTSAGMNQFKTQFMGKNIKYPRVTTCQKCLRTGDMAEVGKTPYHHTFFEMLGNFSFGNYFKKESIAWAWEFLTDVMKIDPAFLWVSVYQDDDEAYKIWKEEIKLPEHKIIRHGDKENYWPSEAIMKGPNGPCGPCSEIFFDRGRDKGCREKNCRPGCSCIRFVEVWNLVFTQYQRGGELGKRGKMKLLANKNIDTGMGLERMAQVMQGVNSNFEIDIFKPLIDFIIKSTGLKKSGDSEVVCKINTIADHIRAAVFVIGDGVIPSNESRGYVIRKLIRRAKYLLSTLGSTDNCLHQAVPVIANVMKTAYPQLEKRRENIALIILEEEKKYDDLMKTLPLRENELNKRCKDSVDAGQIAFEFYDTFGIPKEITKKMAMDKLGKRFREEQLEAAFKIEMDLQKKRARKGSSIKSCIFEGFEYIITGKPTKFTGYEQSQGTSTVIAILAAGRPVNSTKDGSQLQIILKESPFYAEAGGQAADMGVIKSSNFEAVIEDVKAVNSIFLHCLRVKSGQVKVGDKVELSINEKRRSAIAENHTATHLLQAALRKILGEHVAQSGSYVDNKHLRFDFTHFKQLSSETIKNIENEVNGYIRASSKVKVELMSFDKAQKKQALAFFKEKYSGTVRVISIDKYSRELCGGTHVTSTGQIGLFKITSESSIASGIRRIEALTGESALDAVREQEEIIKEAAELLKTNSTHLPQSIAQLIKENKDLKSRLNKSKLTQSKKRIDSIIKEAKTEGKSLLINAQIDNADMNALRIACDMIRQKVKSAAIVLGSIVENQALLIVSLSDDLVKKKLNANDIIGQINPELESRGGGRASLAQAGGGNPAKLKSALDKSYKVLLEALKKIN
ncbi:MAG: alanine--tRNA ligase [Candidatus Omnitrophica bacterium]|nr:alanine--tRNA ligase [Candidatus Omnitrophota bacterium]